jgi:hypothetical protein
MQTEDEESDGGWGFSGARKKERKKIFVWCFFIILKPAAVADV